MVDFGSTLGLACGTLVRPPAAVATATVTSVATIAVRSAERIEQPGTCLLYTSDAADE